MICAEEENIIVNAKVSEIEKKAAINKTELDHSKIVCENLKREAKHLQKEMLENKN